MTNTLHFILSTLSSVLVGLFVLRFLLQQSRADFYNPISQAIVKITNPLVMPLRKLIPGLGGMDLASIVAALLVQLATTVLIVVLLTGGSLPPPMAALVTALSQFINLILRLYFMMILLRVILSWVNPDPRNPMMSLLYSLTEPVMAPARRLIPPMGGLDLSPILVLFVISALQVFVNSDLIPRLPI